MYQRTNHEMILTFKEMEHQEKDMIPYSNDPAGYDMIPLPIHSPQKFKLSTRMNH